MDSLDRALINELQRGFPISPHPYAEMAALLGTSEEELLTRLRRLLEKRILTRFGPLFHAERMGGGLTLAAMAVPEKELEKVAEIVNRFPEVAHNYARDHRYNLWFVLATEHPERIAAVIAAIEAATGYPVLNLPKEEEYYVGLHLPV